MSYLSLGSNTPVIDKLDHQDNKLFELLYRQLVKKQRRNRLRTRYYDHKATVRDLGIAIPPHLKDIDTVVGWPAKAVDAMSRRSRLERITRLDGGSIEDIGLTEIYEANRLAAVMPQTNTQALIHSTALAFVTMGDVEAGEPEALISTKSAMWATGRWNHRLQMLDAALSITEVDRHGSATGINLYTPGRALIMTRHSGGRWDVRQSVHDLGMPVEQFPYGQTLDRPFGRSRINRPMMALTDSAVRTLLRTEVGAEFYNAPRAVALGADADAFTDKDGNLKTGWEVMLGQMLTLSRDVDGELPQIHEFKQQSMQPNLEQLRMYAQQFASEANLPLRSFGIVGDNPESAEAIREANEELALEVTQWETETLTPGWKRIIKAALRVYDDSDAARRMYDTLHFTWRSQETATKAAQADAFAKIAAVRPDLAETEVGLEMAGVSPDQIERMNAELRTKQGQQTLRDILSARATAATDASGASSMEPALQGA